MAEDCLAMASCTDDMLVTMAQGDDPGAFSELMRRTFSRSLKLARFILDDIEEAEDQVQNSYLKAWLHLAQFQRQSKFSTWISRIVTNQCLMRLRQLRGKTFVYLDDHKDDERIRQAEIADSGCTPEEALSVRQMAELLRHEITGLPPLLRDVLMLRDFNETSTAEVAGNLGISEFAVKSRLLRARNEVRARWDKREAISRRETLSIRIAAHSKDIHAS
jgi:RNA polymerase sigma-70 factor (ECF subfamily)